ncbi:MAG: hypothetical protein ACI9T9_001626, partial [Oleiphilaceae bacterium]
MQIIKNHLAQCFLNKFWLLMIYSMLVVRFGVYSKQNIHRFTVIMYAIEAKAVLSYFLGDWEMHRVISGVGEMAGRATFRLNGESDQR